jgi:SAM-dependent methyltransferase
MMISDPATPDDQTALFRKSWTLYDEITERNYMCHREIYAAVATLLRSRSAGNPYTVLDLGCGNARFLAPCLEASPPAAYHGVDLSSAALGEAEDHLSGISKKTLTRGEMLSFLEGSSGSFDLIFTGFAVHHLDTEAKQRFFKASSLRLAPCGELIMVDVARGEGETRECYLESYIRMMRTAWTGISPEHLEEACAHVKAHDFPETVTGLKQMAFRAGFSQSRLVARHGQHHLLEFAKD